MAKTTPSQTRLLIIVVAAAIVLLASMYVPGMVKKYHRNREVLADARARLQKVIQWRDEYTTAQKNEQAIIEQAQSANASGDLWSTINRSVQELELTDRVTLNTVANTTGNLTQIEVNVNGVSLKELVDLLHKIYSANRMVLVQELRALAPAKDGKGLDCRMVLLAPKV